MERRIVDYWSLIIAVATLFFSWSLFWNFTNNFYYSFLAALLAAAMIWISYIIIKILILTFKQ